MTNLDFTFQILFHTAGIVFLTLVINGTTTKGLLQTLKLTDITVGQKEEMNNAVRRIKHLKWCIIQSMKMQKSMIDTNWELVDYNCKITNPYDDVQLSFYFLTLDKIYSIRS